MSHHRQAAAVVRHIESLIHRSKVKTIFLIAIFLIFVGCNSYGQSTAESLQKKFRKADSIVLVSHLLTCVPDRNENTDEFIKPLRLVTNNKVNNKIINGRYVLSSTDIDTLAKLLTEPYTLMEIEDIECFLPHHGILIYFGNKSSYFDICFGCRHFISSKDFKVSDVLMDATWVSLELFFINRGLTYRMPSLGLDDGD